ncbi:MAG TPA: hypothetical protein ENI95_15350 [Chloroflexi bacterium]|nr:hypothetical protein [Chloroflexota bacterium]
MHGETQKRSELSEGRLREALQEAGAARLAGAEEVWVVLDSSDLRKPHAEQMEGLMRVRDLEGKLVPGYRVLNALGITPGARGLLYHRLFSSQEPGFESEPREYRQAIRSVGQVLSRLTPRPEVTWLLDRAFDDEALWGVVWAQEHHLVVRLQHLDRLVDAPDRRGRWRQTKVKHYGFRLPEVGRIQTRLKVRVGKQKAARLQTVPAVLYAGPMRVRYRVGRAAEQDPQTRAVWLLRVQVLGSDLRWWLMTDWPVDSPEAAARLFQMYRMRWAVEDAFKFIKQSLGWEQVQVLALQAIRSLVALAAVAAAFLFEWGVTLEWPAVQLLAQLGGWVPRKHARPGKIILTRGLRRLLDLLAARTILTEYLNQHGELPPQVAAFLPDDFW